MRKSIELGRAVLSTTTTNLELWLKTLITISPQQQCTNLEQHDAISLLGLLSSGEVWVGRGNGLYLDLSISFKGQLLADEQLRQLSGAVLQAPVWKQLNLQPSLPHGSLQEPGKLRMLLSHSIEPAVPAAKPHHRAISDISIADLRPPTGVSAFSLDSVLLFMDVFEIVHRRKMMTVKRLKIITDGNNVPQSGTSQTVAGYGCGKEVSQNPLGSRSNDHLPASSSTLKRCHSPILSSQERTSSLVTPLDEVAKDHQRASNISDIHNGAPSTRIGFSITDLSMLIDAALRLSVTNNTNSKVLPGIKVKANTFGPGLADIAPKLWRPGHSLVRKDNYYSSSVISRSLGQLTAAERATSASLSMKLSALAAPMPSFQTLDETMVLKPENALDEKQPGSHIAPRLWLHLQKNAPCKSSTPLQSFVAAQSQFTSPSSFEDMLEDLWQEGEKDPTSRPGAVGPDRNVASNFDQVLRNYPATTQLCGVVSPKLPVDGLGVTDDELLLGDECFEPLHRVVDLSDRDPLEANLFGPRS